HSAGPDRRAGGRHARCPIFRLRGVGLHHGADFVHRRRAHGDAIDMENLTGRLALVTGGSRGIGRAIALALAREGADVVANYRTHAPDGIGPRCRAIQADVSIGADVERLIAAAGPVDILVNNAGIARPQPIEEITERDWDELIDVNLKSCFLVTQAVLPGMRSRQWGRIINISSVAAQT